MIEWLSRSGRVWNFTIYGPWGSGKSEFARAFTWSMKNKNENIVLYLDLSREKSDIVLLSDYDKSKLIIEVIKTSLGKLGEIILKMYKVIRKIVEICKLENHRFIIFIDEVKHVLHYHSDSIEYLVSSAENVARDCVRDLNLKSINIIFITSEQTLVRDFLKCEGKFLTTLLFWHLDREGFFKLMKNLDFHDEHIINILYKLSGGCPRLAIDFIKMYRRDITLLVLDYVDRFMRALLKYLRVSGKYFDDILKEFKLILDNVDNVELCGIYDIFLEHNITIPLVPSFKHLSQVQGDYVGKRAGFQLPLYYYITRLIFEKGSIDIDSDDVKRLMSYLESS
ncbi:MAG: AAA family ATPase [Crenarchaeota archaeon]|nr:AAA family ATPase [Thermoproteota archaeon]